MSRISPTLEGFRAAWRQPSFTLAEIAWRWTVGVTAFTLLAFGFVEYLKTLPVTDAELLLLRTRHPVLVEQAIANILRGSLNRIVAAGLVGVLALTALWVLAASVGRTATVRALLQYFGAREYRAATSDDIAAVQSGSVRGLFGLQYLRAAVALSVILGLLAAAILAGFVSTTAHPRPGLAILLFLPLAATVGLLGGVLNWFLSLSALFAVRDGLKTLAAVSVAVDFCRERIRNVLAVSTWTGLAHLAIFIGATTAISMPLAFLQIAPARLIFFVVVVMSLVYFALIDWLYMVRLAGYVCIAETPEALFASPPPLPAFPPAADQFAAIAPLQTTIDRDELILSDLSNSGSNG